MYKRNTRGWLKHLDFLILDLISLQVSLLIAYIIRQGIQMPYRVPIYREIAFVLVLIHIAVVFFSESYSGILRRGYWREMKAVFRHASITMLIMVLFLFTKKSSEDFSRMVFGVAWMLYIAIGYCTRLLLKKIIKKRNQQNPRQRSMLIIATREYAEEVINHVREKNYEGIYITGLVLVAQDGSLDEHKKIEEINGIPVVADLDTVLEYANRKWVDEVFVYIAKNIPLPVELMNRCVESGIVVHLNLDIASGIRAQAQVIDDVAGYTVMSNSLNMATQRQVILKRSMDIVGGAVGCVLTAIIFLFLAPVIYSKSPGPIFFQQERIGKNGRRFKIYKFRSMYVNADEAKKELLEQNKIEDGMMFKMENDPRIIKGVGHFIRNHSIDEFPQFLNVLKGEMSLVGTRPPTPDEWDKYETHHRARLAMKPGITGLWQISGRSNIVDFEEVVKLDTEYIMNWDIGQDIKILLKTVLIVFKNNGAM